MKLKLILFLTLLFSLQPASAAVKVLDANSANLGTFFELKCSNGAVCARASSARATITAEQPIVTVSANIVATAAQCGSAFVNSAQAIVTLPEASTVLGCEYTFITGNASSFNINPDRTNHIDAIKPIGTAGNSIYTATVGNSITIKAVGNDLWAPVGKEQGTWTAGHQWSP